MLLTKFHRAHRTAAAVAALFVSAGSAVADPSIQLTSHGRGSGPGGEFNFTVVGSQSVYTHSVGSTFKTFCLETNEYIGYGSTYDVIVNTGAVKGGLGGQTSANFDPLDSRTAYLFQKFTDGVLSSYAYTGSAGSQNASADALQNALWYLENEIGSVSGQALTWVNEATNAVNNSLWSGIGNVRVLNLYAVGHAGDLNYVKQDQLVSFPTPIPAPGAVVLGMVGLSVLGWVRRKAGI